MYYTIEQRVDALERDIQRLSEQLSEHENMLVVPKEPEEPEEPVGLLPEEVRIAAVPAWDAARKYHEGEVCRYQDRLWIALSDVADFPPNEAYDAKARTGGWMPV
jgi:hypothetical protein